jgi:FixJ family two-component response regulator
MKPVARIAIIDDDEGIRDSVCALLKKRGYRVASFCSAPRFLAALEGQEAFDCIVCDIRLPVMSGTALHQELRSRGSSIPLLFITGHGDVDLAVASIKDGATDFIEKPIDGDRLRASIEDAIGRARDAKSETEVRLALKSRFDGMSARQKEVMQLAAMGHSNKEIASMLNLSPRTVEHYREWVMEKMQARNFADLVHMAVLLKVLKSPD